MAKSQRRVVMDKLSSSVQSCLCVNQLLASVMLVQQIRKLKNLQDELGKDANRGLEAMQRAVGMRHAN